MKPIQRIRFHNSVYKQTTTDDDDGRGYVIDQEQMMFNQNQTLSNLIDQQFTDAVSVHNRFKKIFFH